LGSHILEYFTIAYTEFTFLRLEPVQTNTALLLSQHNYLNKQYINI